MLSKVTDQRVDQTLKQKSTTLIDSKSIQTNSKQHHSHEPANDLQQLPALARTNSYQSNGSFAFLVMKL